MPRYQYSNLEMSDIVAVYTQENHNGHAAARRYQLLYPNRTVPNHKTFQRIFQRFRESGSVRRRGGSGRPVSYTPQQEENILMRIEQNQEISIRKLSARTGISSTIIYKVIHRNQLHPYHFTPVQHLKPRDLPARLAFCRRIRGKQNNNAQLMKSVLFTDEATFTRRGVFNWRNSHIWAEENPHKARVHHFQDEFSINVWCGIIGDNVLGPVELPNRLNGASYLQFLRNNLDDLLNNANNINRRQMWFMQDGAPPHFSIAVRNHLNERFPHRWIGRGSEFAWPARSPDLNPLDFFAWGYMKSLVYGSQVIENRNELFRKIQEAGNIIKNQEEIPFRLRQNIMKRCRKCIEVNGNHIENLRL